MWSKSYNWYKECVISSKALATQATTFAITDARLCLPVVELSVQVNAKSVQVYVNLLGMT